MYDYSKLKGRIAEKGYTKCGFAKVLNMHPNSLSYRLDNKLEFTQEDIVKICDVLGIKHKDIPVYFFTLQL